MAESSSRHDHVVCIRNGEDESNNNNNNNNNNKTFGIPSSLGINSNTTTTTSSRVRDDKEKRRVHHHYCSNNNNNTRIIKTSGEDARKVIHSVKVGISLVLVSLFYLLNPLFDQVGENAMWAIITVVVIFEFSAGATLGKGFNRGLGTVLGGGLGCLAAIFAQNIGGVANPIIIATCIFISGTVGTYVRLIPRIKQRYEYGVMIFMLTFNLVVVSGVRGVDERVWEIARERLLTIVMGFIVCICVALFVFPLWSSDQLHHSTVSTFLHLATTIQALLGPSCFHHHHNSNHAKFVVAQNQMDPAPPPSSNYFTLCNTLLNSKSKDEILANFAKWEPCHGNFGFSYPWDKYLKIGEALRELAAIILALGRCLQTSKQVQAIESVRQSPMSVQIESWEAAIGSKVAWALRELGESMKQMSKCKSSEGNIISAKLKAARAELSLVISTSKITQLENSQVLAIASIVLLLTQVLDKVEDLVKQVEELGEIAHFRTQPSSS